ncbi:adenosylcobinamide-GDP ribazoletransferase [Fundidesulfovibrio butyratiphilus]
MSFASPRHFLTALAFLTRLVPGRHIREADLAPSVAWFPLAGLAVGALCVAPVALGLYSAAPGLAGWLTVALALWITRGLHADGLSDLADAWGSSARGERFWSIMKDSRVGAFGVMALVLGLGGFAQALGLLAARGDFGAMALCFLLGRLGACALLAVGRSLAQKGLSRPGLGALFHPGATPAALAFALVQAVAVGLVLAGPRPLLAGLAATAVVVWALARLARAVGGVNGDFVGAAVVLAELGAALAMAA